MLVKQENNYDINLLSKHTNNRLKELVLLSFIEIKTKNDQRDLPQEGTNFILLKKTTLFLSKSFLKMISSKCLSFFINKIQELHKGLLKKKEKKLVRSFNFTFHYIDNVLSLNNSKFRDFFYRIYPIELEIKDITDADMSASYLDIDLAIDNEGWIGRICTTKVMISIFPL